MKYIAIVVGLIIVWVLFWNIPVNGIHFKTSSGSQVGYVSAIEKQGVFWKTGRVYIKPTLESSQEDIYCVKDAQVFSQLENASITKSNVKISHFSWFASGFKNCEGEPAIVEKVEIL